MDIAFVCDTMGSGGAERVISTLSNEFVNRGHNVSIIMLSSVAEEPFYLLDNRINLVYLSRLSNKEKTFFKKAKTLKRVLIGINPDVVVSFLSYVCIYVWWALKNIKIPYIVSERNDPNQRGKIKQFLLNKSFKKAAGCVFQTEDALNWYKDVIKGKTEVIHNPVNLDYLPSNITNRKKQILYVGRFTDQKNCLMLLDSFSLFSKNHPDYILKMYGSGPLETEIRQKITDLQLKDKVIILPNSKTWQKEESDSAMFVLPSKYEGMPNVLAESLCLGIPSVSTDCTIGGPKELKKIFKNHLFLSNTINSESFFDAMERCMGCDNVEYGIPAELETSFIALKWLKFIEEITKK